MFRGQARVLAIVAVLAVVALPRALAQAPGAQSLPARLSDAEFWSLIQDLSEAGGAFHGDNFTSNEPFADQAASLAARRHGGAYLGVGPEQNFSYIVATRPAIAFVIDIRRQAVVQHLLFKALFELSADRAEFLSRLFSRPKPQGPRDQPLQRLWDALPAGAGTETDRYLANRADVTRHLTVTHGFALSADDLKSLDYVYEAFFKLGPAISYQGFSTRQLTTGNLDFTKLSLSLDAGGVARSFLGSEDNFRVMKDLHQRNLFVPVQGDFGGPKTLRSIGEYLRVRKILVNAFYISNVEQYLFGQSSSKDIDVNGGWRAFYANLATLPIDDDSLLVRTPAVPRPGMTTPRSTCPIGTFLKEVDADRIKTLGDTRRCG
jgi:hypothetical protein